MSTTTREYGGSAPKRLFPESTAIYPTLRELSWPLVRLTVGGTLLVHGINKLMGPGVAAFASGSLARRGIEPALPLAYVVFFLETVGAVMIMLGWFTRLFAAAIAIEFSIITFVAHWPNGFGWTNPRGGWEYPLLWGLMFLAIALHGGGPYSLDRKIGREL
jgi:putative oxidoreductase